MSRFAFVAAERANHAVATLCVSGVGLPRVQGLTAV